MYAYISMYTYIYIYIYIYIVTYADHKKVSRLFSYKHFY